MKLSTKQNTSIAEFAKSLGVEPLKEGEKVSKSTKALERKRGGPSKKGDGKILIETSARRGKKTITTIKGLEAIDNIKLKDIAKALGKKFASGAAVKTAPNNEEIIEIQGTVSYDLPQFLVETYSAIKKDMIYLVDEDGKKNPAF